MIDLLARVDQSGRIRWKRSSANNLLDPDLAPRKGAYFCPRKATGAYRDVSLAPYRRPEVSAFGGSPSSNPIAPRSRVSSGSSLSLFAFISVSKIAARGGNLILRKFFPKQLSLRRSRFVSGARFDLCDRRIRAIFFAADKHSRQGRATPNSGQQTKLPQRSPLIKRSRDFIILLLIAQIYHTDR